MSRRVTVYRQPRPTQKALPRSRRIWMTRSRFLCVAAESRGTRSRVRSLSASLKAATACSRRSVPDSRSPRVPRAAPRLLCVMSKSPGHALAGPLLERLVEGGHGLLKALCPRLPLAQGLKSNAEIALRRGPVEGHALAGPLLERLVEGGHGLLKALCPRLPLAQGPKSSAEVASASWPSRGARARGSAP